MDLDENTKHHAFRMLVGILSDPDISGGPVDPQMARMVERGASARDIADSLDIGLGDVMAGLLVLSRSPARSEV